SASNTGNLLYLNSSGVSSSATGLRIVIAGSGLAELIDGAVAWKSTAYTSTGTQNNVTFSKSTSTVRLNPASALTITGIVAGSDGQLLTLWNASSNTVTLADANSGSSAANRLSTGSGINVLLAAGATAIL
ncbi:MAG TPA: hypothetical protein VLE73_06230, partial [Candidatus Saccharimonadales bacterium]|nr:hypothetical protein [Candidatus Saccharimonadales bacterium]